MNDPNHLLIAIRQNITIITIAIIMLALCGLCGCCNRLH